ncbi:hypothetical protein Q1695_015293 [Nippostrongylus brasiliensis]|nr:hypothetical protein Q1695_015293 [Nippostrongylus brasiliensis]
MYVNLWTRASSVTTSGGTAATKSSPGASQPTVPGSSSTGSTSSTSTTTSTPSTLPPVDVEYVEFQRNCVVDGDCTYVLVAPHNDQKFLATEKSAVDQDRVEVTDISAKIQQFSDSLDESTNGAHKKMLDLARQLQTAQQQLNKYQDQLKQIQKNLDDTEYQLQFTDLYLQMVSYNPQDCYFPCLSATTMTPPPSTTPSPCSDYECAFDGVCDLDTNNQPYCKCVGNLDGSAHCYTGACIDSGMDVMTDSNTTALFYSPFYGPDTVFEPPTKDLSCMWTLVSTDGATGYKTYNTTSFDFTNLHPSASLLFFLPNGAKVQATNQFTLKKLQSVLQEAPIVVVYTAPANVDSTFFFDAIEL